MITLLFSHLSLELSQGNSLEGRRLSNLRRRVAREAAVLLYESQEKEYKQAKERAARILGARILPKNVEVAEELDKIAQEKEGASRQKSLIRKRKGALQIMKMLRRFHPKLVGSVWRGTAHQNSDIDILAFSSNAKLVEDVLQKRRIKIARSEWRSVTKHGKKEASFHIHFVLLSGDEVEIAVRSPEKIAHSDECEIYGDAVVGLTYSELEEVLDRRPLHRFLPK